MPSSRRWTDGSINGTTDRCRMAPRVPRAMPERDGGHAPGASGKFALRGPALTFTADPHVEGVDALRYESDALIVVDEGRIAHVGPASTVREALAADVPIRAFSRDPLILPGFIDCHVHYPQLQIIGAHGAQLLDWLQKYTFVAEQRFADPEHARGIAATFLDECLRQGTTTV